MTQKIGTISSFLTSSNGGLTATQNGGGGSFHLAFCSEFFTTGSNYWEMTDNPLAALNSSTGISTSGAGLDNYLGSDANGVGLSPQGNVFNNAGFTGGFPTRSQGDRMAIETNLGAGTIKWRNVTTSGAWSSTFAIPPAMLTAGVTPASAVSNGGAADAFTFFFTPSSWLGTPESGFGPFDRTCGGLALLGVGCAIWAAKKIDENPMMSRRRLILPTGGRIV